MNNLSFGKSAMDSTLILSSQLIMICRFVKVAHVIKSYINIMKTKFNSCYRRKIKDTKQQTNIGFHLSLLRNWVTHRRKKEKKGT